MLTLGFARRVATYKRLDLLTRDPEWTLALLGGERPVQVVLAGKAHPRDEEAKRSLQRLFGLKYARIIGERVVFLDDYDLDSAAWLVRGCDVWLNVPRPPLEASGTSGMKSVVNGGLQLSVLDGWWAEAYDGSNGWGLPGEVRCRPSGPGRARRRRASPRCWTTRSLPAFYERDDRRAPERWLARMRASLRTLGPRFSASRMLREYVEGPYRGSPDARRESRPAGRFPALLGVVNLEQPMPMPSQPTDHDPTASSLTSPPWPTARLIRLAEPRCRPGSPPRPS